MEEEDEYDFASLLDFQEKILSRTDYDLFLHLKLLLMAQKYGLWFNPETMELITEQEKKLRLNRNELDENNFSVNPAVRVFGNLTLFELKLSGILSKFREDVKDYSTTTYMQLNVLDSELRIQTMVNLFLKLTSSLIWCLCLINDRFQLELCYSRELWNTLWIERYIKPNLNSSDIKNKNLLIPAVYNLQRLYLELQDKDQATYIVFELPRFPLSTMEVKSRILRLTDRLFLVEGDIVEAKFIGDEEDYNENFYIHQNESGYEIIKLEFDGDNLKLPEEASMIAEIKGRSYWD